MPCTFEFRWIDLSEDIMKNDLEKASNCTSFNIYKIHRHQLVAFILTIIEHTTIRWNGFSDVVMKNDLEKSSSCINFSNDITQKSIVAV